MAENVQQSVEVPVGLSLFGSLNTEMSPSDLPEGISPDCQDIVFLPGSISSRPALHKLGYTFPANTTVTYQKTFLRPDGVKMNLFLTSDGSFFVENASQTPYTLTKIGQVTPGSYANSMTAFGREYIAFHNGIVGTDIPRQYDGTFFDRVTQCGPAQAPDLQSTIIPASTLRSYSFADGPFIVIPVQGGGSVAIGCGSESSGSAITLPVGYLFTNSVSWGTAGNGWNRLEEVVGVFAASSSGGNLSASFEGRTGISAFTANCNWGMAAWTAGAGVTVTVIGGLTYVAFTTQNGDNLCVCAGSCPSSSPTITTPGGFSSGNFAYILGPGSTDTVGHGMQGVNTCSLSGTTTSLVYIDGSSNTWTGTVNVFGVFWSGGGITSGSITGGNYIEIPTTGGQTVAIMYGQNLNSGGVFSLPATISLVSSTCGMSGFTLVGQTFIAHGWLFCQMTGQSFLGSYQDGQGNSWPGMANFIGLGISNATPGSSLQRDSNTVTGQTLTPHGLQIGYLVQISGVAASAVGSSIVSIVINNEDNPGIATVTTATPHGLLPNNNVTITDIPPTSVGGGISSVVRAGDLVTLTTASAHGLLPGAVVTVTGVSDVSFNGTFIVGQVLNSTMITYSQVDVDGNSTGGTITLNWPIPADTPTPTYYQVLSSPTPNTFQIPISYTDGSWTGGTVSFAWNGTFYVTAIPDQFTFQYQQYGPNASTSSTGVVTPFGQAAPGLRNCVLLFQTRQGFITAPSPPTLNFVTNGGQYIQVTNIATGPPNIQKRILAFTGAGGDNYFYIPIAPQINGLLVGTSTVLEDNTTTSVLLDFSDNTLFNSTAIDIPGQNYFAMGVLGPCLGPFNYADRTAWYGHFNDLQNLLNLGFDGGILNNDLTIPLGWDVSQTRNGILSATANDWGWAWVITSDGSGDQLGLLSQPVNADYLGISIFEQSKNYTIQVWLKLIGALSSGGSVAVTLTSVSLGYNSVTFFPIASLSNTVGQLYSQELSVPIPEFIPSDLTLNVYLQGASNGVQVAIDELQIIDAQVPISQQFQFSYVEAPEQLDLVTGPLGATDDNTNLQAAFTYRDGMRFLTSRGLHETQDLDSTEPSGWAVRQITDNCGCCGPRACATGENFSVWMTSPSSSPPVGRGLYIYTGGEVYKLSQEIQPDFDRINDTAASSIWIEIDSINRRILLGIPQDGSTAPSIIYVLDYRELDTASDIASRAPIHVSFTGKMVCSDLSRKWTRWNMSINCARMMYFSGVGTTLGLGTGNGQTPGDANGFASTYWLDPTKLTDDDFGQVVPYYTTYFFINHEAEQALQVGLHRKLYKRYYMYVTGVGQIQLTPYGDTLANPWMPPPTWPLAATAFFDIGDGLNVIADRCAFRIGSIPNIGQTDNSFNIGKFIVTMCQEPVAPLRFGAV